MGRDGLSARLRGLRGRGHAAKWIAAKTAVAVAVVLVACGFTLGSNAGRAGASTGWTGWVSSPSDPGRRLVSISETAASSSPPALVYPTDKGQTWLGAGGALTDAAVRLLNFQPGALGQLYDPNDPTGAHLNLLRLPVSATDFSPGWWSWTWDPKSQTATAPAAQRQSQQMVTKVLGLRPDLGVVATPWTAPASMKAPAALNGGVLVPGQEQSYADLLFAQARWLQSRGVPVRAMTVGNEPGFETTGYPTMKLTDDQMVTLANFDSDRLKKLGVALWAVDHNWNNRNRVDTVLAGAPGKFAAAAFHCYGGTPGQMAGLPVPSIITECTGTTDTFDETFRWDAANLVVAAIQAGSTGLFLWNLALNQTHGPHKGGCDNCRGIVTINTKDGSIQRNPEFYLLGQLSRAVLPGAVRLRTGSIDHVPMVSFLNTDGTVGVFGHNDTGSAQTIGVHLIGTAETHNFSVGPGELFSFRGPPGDISPGHWSKGKIIRSPDGYRYYVDTTGHRHFIRNDEIFSCNGGWERTIDNVAWSEITALPEAEQAECFLGHDGDIIRHPDGDSYVLENTAGGLIRHWIPTAADYVCARAEANRAVVPVTRYQIVDLPSGADRRGGNCIVRAPGGDAHYINNEGRREWIPDSPTWDCEVGRGTRILDVPAGFVDSIDQVGWHYCLNRANLYNKILRHADGDAHVIFPDDTSTWIPDSPTWDCRMRQGMPIVDTRWREYVTAFTDHGWDYCFDPVVFRNKILRHSDGDSYFIHADDTKTWIPDSATWACRANQSVPVVDTRWREYVNRFSGTEWDYCYDINTLKGRIITHPDGDSHYVDAAGIRHWIPNSTVFNCLRARGIAADTVRWRDYINRTPEGEWAVCGDTLGTNQKLDRGQWLQSGDGRYRLYMQTDGNLVAYNSAGRAIWATNRSGQFAIVQNDGNLVEYTSSGTAVWSTGTMSTGADHLVMQSDGNLVLYSPSRAVWASNTYGQ